MAPLAVGVDPTAAAVTGAVEAAVVPIGVVGVVEMVAVAVAGCVGVEAGVPAVGGGAAFKTAESRPNSPVTMSIIALRFVFMLQHNPE
jgi:hypothetical protein